MKRWATLLAIVPSIALAQTDAFCAQLQAAMTTPATTFTFQTTAACTQSIAIGGAVSMDCAWGFDYRAELATEMFNNLRAAVEDCAAPIDTQDPDVSHPDSYDLRQFTLGDGIISVSLKDKGALSQTFVFLRVQP